MTPRRRDTRNRILDGVMGRKFRRDVELGNVGESELFHLRFAREMLEGIYEALFEVGNVLDKATPFAAAERIASRAQLIRRKTFHLSNALGVVIGRVERTVSR